MISLCEINLLKLLYAGIPLEDHIDVCSMLNIYTSVFSLCLCLLLWEVSLLEDYYVLWFKGWLSYKLQQTDAVSTLFANLKPVFSAFTLDLKF